MRDMRIVHFVVVIWLFVEAHFPVVNGQAKIPYIGEVPDPYSTAIVQDGEDSCPKAVEKECKFQLHAIRSRDNFGEMCEERGFTVAAELGVQSGRFSDSYLYTAPSTKKYILVDTWAKRDNYSDSANVDDNKQESLFQHTMKRLHPYKARGTDLEVHRMYTNKAAANVPNNSIDFIYVDAQHDYCGGKEDLEMWWPKLKVGGIMAGDDYLSAKEQLHLKGNVYDPNDDWAICKDGSRHEGAVKGAVRKFAAAHNLQVFSTWKQRGMSNREKLIWPQWIYSRKKEEAL